MSDESVLIAGCRAAPRDDLSRLVYADWLDEHGRPEAAEWLRLEAEYARRWPSVPPELAGRFDAVTADRDPDWLAAVGWYRWPFLRWLVGRPVGPTVWAVESAVGEQPEYHSRAATSWSVFREDGLVIWTEAATPPSVGRVVLTAAGDASGEFPGTLPAGLTFDAVRAEVEARLGQPARQPPTGAAEFVARYPALGLEVSYGVPSPADHIQPIHSLTFRRPW
jgi:uncharacterized protein (TIGR02996 family)